jgi:hypothetical protein
LTEATLTEIPEKKPAAATQSDVEL